MNIFKKLYKYINPNHKTSPNHVFTLSTNGLLEFAFTMLSKVEFIKS